MLAHRLPNRTSGLLQYVQRLKRSVVRLKPPLLENDITVFYTLVTSLDYVLHIYLQFNFWVLHILPAGLSLLSLTPHALSSVRDIINNQQHRARKKRCLSREPSAKTALPRKDEQDNTHAAYM